MIPRGLPKGKVRMISEIKLAEMLCTRLCHDLTGPIGAVNNGAEFLSEEGFDLQHEAMQLIISSAHQAVNRLQFYRQAYGRVNDHGEASLSEKKALVEQFFSGTKLKLDWPDSHTDASGISVSQKMARLVLNLVIVASASLIKGGTIAIRVAEDAQARSLTLTGTGDMVKLDAETAAILRGEIDEEEISPKTAQAFLTTKIASELGASIHFTVEATTITMEARQPIAVAQFATS
jgi:histidine phosphotransferase ChpT